MSEFTDQTPPQETYRRDSVQLHGESARIHTDVMAYGSNMFNLPKDIFTVSATINMGVNDEQKHTKYALGMYRERTSGKVYVEGLEDAPEHFYRPAKSTTRALDERMANWVELEDGVIYTVGRNLGAAEQDPDANPTMLTGARLLGRPFSVATSARHATLQRQGEEVIVKDLGSTNGTNVFYAISESGAEAATPVVADPETVEEIGDVALPDSTRPELITAVPTTAQEAIDFIDAAETGRQVALQRAMQAELAPVEAKFDALRATLNAIDSSAVWRYASATLNMREMQAAGRRREADFDGHTRTEALKEMTPAGRAIAEKYLQLFGQMHAITAKYRRQR